MPAASANPLRPQITGQAGGSQRQVKRDPDVGRKAKPTLPTTASAAYAIDHEQAPNRPPTPRSFVPRVDSPPPGLLVLLELHTAVAAAVAWQTTAASFPGFCCSLVSGDPQPEAHPRLGSHLLAAIHVLRHEAGDMTEKQQ